MSLVKELTDFLRNAPHGKSLENWLTLSFVREAYLALAEEYISSLNGLPSFPLNLITSFGTGKGIVTLGGGEKYFPSLFVLCNQLRELKCTLPIEVWYLGELEFDPIMLKLLEPFQVIFRDATEVIKEHPARIMQGWQMKPYCILHSGFKEVLFIDADNAPNRNPEFLFENRNYHKTGAVFWPDFFHWILHAQYGSGPSMVKEVYQAFGLPLPSNIEPPGTDDDWLAKSVPDDGHDICFESGQILIDKEKCWKPLSLALYYCQHSDYYFNLVFGDKETFHFAWRKLGFNYSLIQTMPDYEVHTTIQFGPDGLPLFEHRNDPDAKWNLKKNPYSGSKKLKVEENGILLMDLLKQIWSGKLWKNTNPTVQEKQLAGELSSRNWLYHLIGEDARLMKFNPDGRIDKGGQKLERYWSVFHNGVPRLVISGDKPTCFLEKSNGIWRGKWLENEKFDVELKPI